MADERGGNDPSGGTKERWGEPSVRPSQDWLGHLGKRLFIGHARMCRRGSPHCFRECICNATLTVDERSLVRREGEVWTAEDVAASVARLACHRRQDDQDGVITIAFAPGYKVQGTAVLLFANDFLLD